MRSRGRNGGVNNLKDVDLGPGISGGAVGHGARLTLSDRVVIQTALAQGLSQARIASMIGCHRSTVSREIRRTALTYRRARPVYSAAIGQHRAASARARPKARVLDRDRTLRAEVIRRLAQRHSPAQVSAGIRKDRGMSISAETIYQALYVQGKGSLRQELAVEKALRSGRTGRIPRSRLPQRRGRKTWVEGANISLRPAEAIDRAVPGHWEGDLVIGRGGKNALITLVERSTRFALISRLPEDHESITVTTRLAQMISALPKALARSLTWDQGTEMAQVKAFRIATGCPVFFCDPHSPWQRGSNENLNGLIRDFYPKGTDFSTITDQQITEMQDLLNTRPRKTLDWDTPAQRIEPLLTTVALTT
nr:IS30 family transposase [Pseudoclavibacter sp. 13-3]